MTIQGAKFQHQKEVAPSNREKSLRIRELYIDGSTQLSDNSTKNGWPACRDTAFLYRP